MKVPSQIFWAPSLMPTFWPAKTWLKLILHRAMQMRPHAVAFQQASHEPQSFVHLATLPRRHLGTLPNT